MNFLRSGLALFSAALTVSAAAHVRQRVYVPDSADGAKGQESIIHWDPSKSIAIKMHQFTGTLGNSSALTFANAQTVATESLAEWNGNLFPSIPSGLTLDLSSGAPYTSTSGCETDYNTGRDVINNIVFTTKMTSSCSTALGATSGIIGLTRVLYQSSTGLVLEADIQFNDLQFKFTNTPGNDLTVSPKVIYLKDVITHELGHFFGLDHSSTRDSTMLFAVSDGLESTEADDRLGLLSLYPSSASSAAMGTLQASVTNGSGTPYFGAVVSALDARTLRTVATELSDPNGSVNFCALPAGNYLMMANRYRPLSTNIHSYYSGDGEGGAEDSAGCFNPTCSLMTSALRTTLLSKTPTSGSGGVAMQVYSVAAATPTRYINITGSEAEPTLDAVSSTSTGSALTLDEPRFAKLGTSNLAVAGGAVTTKHRYNFTAPASGKVQIRTAALRLYGRLKLTLSLRTAALPEVDATTTLCPGLPTADPTDPTAENTLSTSYAVDPWIECDALTSGTSYVLEVGASAASCAEIPGNGSNCESTQSEASSTNLPYYLLTVYDPSVSTVYETPALSASSLATTEYQNLPACGDYSLTVTKGTTSTGDTPSEEKTGGCCGTIRNLSSGGPPNGPKTLLLTLIFSPVAWFVLLWKFWPRNRAFVVTSFRARRSFLRALWDLLRFEERFPSRRIRETRKSSRSQNA